MEGEAKCPHCGVINNNGNHNNLYARCYWCYEYFDIEKAILDNINAIKDDKDGGKHDEA